MKVPSMPDDEVSMPSELDSTDSHPVSHKLDTFKIAVYVLLAISAVNMILMGFIVFELEDTSRNVRTVQTDVMDIKNSAEHLQRMAKPLQGLADMASRGSESVARLFNGGVPAKITDMFCTDISGLAAKVANLAGKLKETLLANGGGTGGTDVEFADVAKISALIESIATVSQNLNIPASCPSTRPGISADGQLTGSGGLLLEPMTYILDFVGNQTDVASWKQAATHCKDFLKSMKQLSWTGSVLCWKCPTGYNWQDNYQIYESDGLCIKRQNNCYDSNCDTAHDCGQPGCTCCQPEPLVSRTCDWDASVGITASDKPTQRVAEWCEAISKMSV